jgi:hypothetical protein
VDRDAEREIEAGCPVSSAPFHRRLAAKKWFHDRHVWLNSRDYFLARAADFEKMAALRRGYAVGGKPAVRGYSERARS